MVSAKRKFADIVKTKPKNTIGTLAFEGNNKITKIYHLDNKMKQALPELLLKERERHFNTQLIRNYICALFLMME